MKYYKVVRNDYNRMRSIADISYPVYYEMNQWTYPHPSLPGSKLFVFKHLTAAERFISNEIYIRCSIYECEIKGTPGIPKFISCISKVKQFWKAKKYKKIIDRNITKSVPSGTRTVDAIKLTKLVKSVSAR